MLTACNGGHEMGRYILLESNCGYIFGDVVESSPVFAAVSLDKSLMNDESEYFYEETGRYDASARYYVYYASDDFPIIDDGQNKELIEACIRDCQYVATVSRYLKA
jgi:hypothetical protein